MPNGQIGELYVFHGNNVVGNKRTGVADEIPRVGNNIDVGFGTVIIGKVEKTVDFVLVREQ